MKPFINNLDKDSKVRFVPRRIDSLLRERTSLNRKEVVECLKDRKVFVSGVLVVDPRQLIFDEAHVVVGCEPLAPAPDLAVFAFNKPSGLISAYKSNFGKPNIGSFMDKMGQNLTHIGRLDKLTTGLLLITNDGDLCHALTDPSCNVEKKYLLSVEGSYEEIVNKVEKLSQPVVNKKTKIEVTYQAQRVRMISSTPSQTQIEVTLTEGKNRQIRRMCAILYLNLLHLHRFSVGPIRLADLKPGEYRRLRGPELNSVYEPFGGIGGFERRRANQLIATLESGGFSPELSEKLRAWKESYLA